MTRLSLAFAGTPEFALPCLSALFEQHTIKAVYTQPDRPAGRGRKLQASPVKQFALTHDIPVYQPLSFKDLDTQNTFQALQIDAFIVIAYGLILPTAVLQMPRFGCINVHASLLPKWRGASPIQQSILHGDAESGITIMQMDKGMDTGDMFLQSAIPIKPQDTSASLHDALAQLAVEPLLQVLRDLQIKNAHKIPQTHAEATYAPKINKQEARINWHEPTSIIDQKIRGYYPWPIAYTYLGDVALRIHQARRVDIMPTKPPGTIIERTADTLRVAAKNGCIDILIIQSPGGKAISISQWLQANQTLQPGMQFT